MNDFYAPSGTPGTGSFGASANMRAEFSAIEAGFDKLPAMAGNGGKVVRVNAGGTALESSDTLTLTTLSLTTLTVTGQILAADGTLGAPGIAFSSATNKGLWATANRVNVSVNATDAYSFGTSTFILGSTRQLAFGDSATASSAAADTILARDAANTLAQRNGTNAQAFRVYRSFVDGSNLEYGALVMDLAGLNITTVGTGTQNTTPDIILGAQSNIVEQRNSTAAQTLRVYNTFTDAANYERCEIVWSGNQATLRTAAAGTGTLRNMNFDGSLIHFATGGTTRWQIDSGGHFKAQTDNSWDIGTASLRPRTGYFGTSLVAPSIGPAAGQQHTLPAVTSDSVALLAATQTFTNKRVTWRVNSVADGTSITPAGDTTDEVTQANTQALGTLTINAPTGTPTDGQRIVLRIKSTNAHTYSFNAIYRGSVDVALPTTHSGTSLTDYLGFIYNSADSRWDLLASVKGFT